MVEGLRVNGVEVPESNKQALEKAIVSNGGKRWQSVPKGQECYVICGRKDCTHALYRNSGLDRAADIRHSHEGEKHHQVGQGYTPSKLDH